MIRPYCPDDIDAVIETCYLAHQLSHPFLSAEFLAQEMIKTRDTYLPNSETWIYEKDGKLRGFIALVGNEVGGLFVHPDDHGKGFGKALMDKAVELRGSVYLDVFKENSLGRAFYKRYGFRLSHEYVHEETGNMLLRLEFG